MPWKVTCPMDEKAKMIAAWLTGRYSQAELAAVFRVSRKTILKWQRCFKEQGRPGLEDRSHAPHHHPNASPAAVVAAVIREKLAHPTWGPLKLQPRRDDPPEVVSGWPAPSTRGAILAREGLTRARRRRRRVPVSSRPFRAANEPNAVWCGDFKGWFRTQDGQRCDPLTVSDAYSRMLLLCRVLPRPDYFHVRPAFEALFREHGLPLAIRTDNGPPFASVGAGGLSPLSVWWVKLDIALERIAPGHPEQNGRHERMHRTLKQDCCRPPALNPAAQALLFDAFTRTFNYERPHQAIGLRPPATLYLPSPRPYPDKLEDPRYPADAAIRRVRSNGQIKWRGNLVFLSEALAGELVGITEAQIGYAVHFGPVALGSLDVKGERLLRPPLVQMEAEHVTNLPG